MIPTAAQAVEAMVAPVVLITAGGILSNGFISVSASVNDRIRTMNHERFHLLSGTDGEELTLTKLDPRDRERARQIDRQVPMLIRRHHLLLDAVMAIYVAIAVLVLAVVLLGLSVTVGSEVVAVVSLAFVLAGTDGLLASLAIAARSTWLSHDAIDFETVATQEWGRAQ